MIVQVLSIPCRLDRAKVRTLVGNANTLGFIER